MLNEVNMVEQKKINKVICAAICVIIMLSVLLCCIGEKPFVKEADALVAGSKTVEIGELLLSGYSTTNGKPVFNGDNLDALYKALTGVNGATLKTLKDLGTRDSSHFRAKNSSKDVVVKLGNFRWNVVYSFTEGSNLILDLYLAEAVTSEKFNDTYAGSKGSYPSNMYGTSKIRSVSLNNGGKYYSSNTALTSTDPGQSKTHRFAFLTMTTTQGVANSITKYIVKPVNVTYQKTESAKSAIGYGYNLNSEAYSTTMTGFNGTTDYYYQDLENGSNAYYSRWKNDYIWLPSLSEVGQHLSDVNAVNGIWKTSNSQLSNSNNGTATGDAAETWLRTARYANNNSVHMITSAGAAQDSYSTNYANVARGVRPAFHLNLTLADQDSMRVLKEPTDVTDKIYNSKDRDITDASWYVAAAYGNSSNMQVEYLNEDGTAPATPNSAGKYKVRFTLLNDKYSWAQNKGTNVREILFEIQPKPIEFTWKNNADGIPLIDTYKTGDLIGTDTVTFSVHYKATSAGNTHDSTDLPKKAGWYTATAKVDNSNYVPKAPADKTFELKIRNIKLPQIQPSNTRVYNGGAYNFAFLYESSDIILSRPTRFNDTHFTLNADKTVATATNVGNYAVSLKLADLDNTQWEGGGNSERELDFYITPAALTLDIVEGDEIDCIVGEPNPSINIEVTDAPKAEDPAKGIKGDTVIVDFIATYNGGMTQTLYSGLEITGDDDSFEIELDITKLPIPGKWDLVLQLREGAKDNANYVLDCAIMLNVLEESEDGTDTWRIKAGNTNVGKSHKVTGGTTEVVFPNAVPYDGRTFEINLKPSAATGYVVDAQYSSNGYVKGYKTEGSEWNTAIGKNADEYTTYVRLIDSSNNVATYTITWSISKAKFDLSNVKWENDGKVPFSTNKADMKAVIDAKTLPKGLVVKEPYTGINTGNGVGDKNTATVNFDFDTSDPSYAINYELPIQGNTDTYDFKPTEDLTDFEWSKNWEIVKMKIDLTWKSEEAEDVNGEKYQRQTLVKDNNVIDYEYYLWDTVNNQPTGSALSESQIEVEENVAKYYVTKAVVKPTYINDVELDGSNPYSSPFTVGVNATAVQVTLANNVLTYNGNAQQVKLKISGALSESDFDKVYYDKDGTTPLDGAPKNAGEYRVEVSIKSGVEGFYLDGDNVTDGVAIIEYEIKQLSIDASDDKWTDVRKPPSLQINKKQLAGIRYEYADSDGNPIAFASLKPGNTYKIRAVITDRTNYAFEDGSFETEWKEFSVSANEVLSDPSDPAAYPDAPDDENPNNPPSGVPSGDVGSGNEGGIGGGSIDEILDKLKDMPLWQMIAGVISIILTLIFLSKTAGYEGKRKKFNKKADKIETSSVYAGAFLGLAMTGWTAIACALMGLAVVSLVIMLIAKSRCNKAEEAYEEAFQEYQQKKEDNMRMMFMGMGNNGGMAQGMQGFAYAQPTLGMDDMRGLISETVQALLPGVQQLLPQQASTNDDLVQRLIDENAKSQETIQELMHSQELLMKKMSEHPAEKIVEREVAASAVDDETIKQMMKTQENLMQNQEKLMEKILELSATQPQSQVVEKVIEKEVPVEKIVEKVVEVPVEKIVEKEVKVEVPVEKVVEKIVEKEVKVHVAAPAKPKKEVAPRLTLDEAYAQMSKQQQKYFDGLRQYALSKPNAKEKTSTYAITIGQSTVNPLLKLTIKKDMTVALFKMEDEYLKDIKRDASGDGTKIKVKETEVIISDAQACKAAKNMIDLREDQIERYNDLLKEQRSMRSKK
ncbi:MAG: hypothetical protein K2M75_06580 [Clostridia bacterium]|nr:hypothetical protein [Clostridia bacterium]